MITLYYTFEKVKSEDFIKKSLALFTGERNFFIKRTENGKPYIDGEIEFSLSNTDGLIICAVSDVPVGADCEKVRNINNKERILARFTKNEEKALSDKEFFEKWTAFESRVKLFGERIVDCLSAVEKEVCTKTFELDGYIVSVSCENNKEIKKERI